MKKLIAIVAFCALAANARPHRASKPKTVEFVLAVNPDPTIGSFISQTLEDAEQEVAELASLDPVCFAVPQVCEARADNTTFYIFYTDGTESVI